jgi:hypothetical protein
MRALEARAPSIESVTSSIVESLMRYAPCCDPCLAILSTYWGWWRLGQDVCMSPLEIARAFGAPLLESADPNATGDDLRRNLGTQKIRFAVDAVGRMHEERSML